MIAGASRWLLGPTQWSWLLVMGGTIPAARLAIAEWGSSALPPPIRPGAPIEELADGIEAFIHSHKREFGDQPGTADDWARKSVTRLAYLAQEMLDGRSDRERYEKLRGILAKRAGSFETDVLPEAARLARVAGELGFAAQPLSQVSAAARRIARALADVLGATEPTAPPVERSLRAILEQRQRLVGAAEDAHQATLACPGCSVNAVIRALLHELSDDLSAAGIEVEKRLGVPEEEDAARLRRHDLRAIVENLLTNAIRALSTSDRRILTVTTASDARTITIAVGDTGCGMDAETRADAFHEPEGSRLRKSGLACSRRVLTKFGGDIRVGASVPGEGTEMIVTLLRWSAATAEVSDDN
jgi:signal transduction histidine kinase